MFIIFLSLFILVPILEIYVLLAVGNTIGIAPTIFMVLATGVAGAHLARSQGIVLVKRIQQEMAAGRMPTEELIDGAMVLVGGLLLLTPGFCTDLAGFFLLAPFSRVFLKSWLIKAFEKKLATGNLRIYRK
ncbi:FxsA family protein [Geopsychrobacter electrodiphilus]|uniref:FxsA family protein n=1 Tax=Geopsychrobacter electrodiphilus TaxID=225196 RepID=UPI0003674AC2|nr:FxsA family protein [Geopsychrobacter electrodiphilus]